MRWPNAIGILGWSTETLRLLATLTQPGKGLPPIRARLCRDKQSLIASAMERPTLRQLEILAEIARAGTFRGAARNLGLSQVAVSDHVKQLENRLGCALFVRTAGGKPSLSPSGRIVLDHGRNVLFACDALIAAARDVADLPPIAAPVSKEDANIVVRPQRKKDMLFAPEPAPATASDPEPPAQNETIAPAPQPVSLGQISPQEDAVAESPEDAALSHTPVPMEEDSVKEKPITVASHPAILSRFQDKLAAAQDAFPDRPIAVDFARFTPETVAPLLEAGTADIALFYALGEVPGLASDYLWSERWSLFARADHPLAQMDEVRFADCADMLVVLFDEGNPLRALCEACLIRARLWPTPTVLETDDFSAIAAELDYGEAIFPAFGVTAAQFAARPGLRRLALVEEMPGVEVRRAVSPLAEEDPTIQALAGLLG